MITNWIISYHIYSKNSKLYGKATGLLYRQREAIPCSFHMLVTFWGALSGPFLVFHQHSGSWEKHLKTKTDWFFQETGETNVKPSMTALFNLSCWVWYVYISTAYCIWLYMCMIVYVCMPVGTKAFTPILDLIYRILSYVILESIGFTKTIRKQSNQPQSSAWIISS